MPVIDPRFIDIDFPSQQQYVFGYTGEVDDGRMRTRYEDAVDIIPQSKWKDEIARIEAEHSGIENLVTRVYNQQNEGSCVANACSQAHEINQARQFGRDRVVHLSAISLYQFIGSSPNSGANINDGLDEGTDKGIVPLDDEANRKLFGAIVMPNIGFRTKRPQGWEQVAAQFSFDERYIIKSKAELITAGINGDPVVVGRAGHSICYLRPTYSSSSLLYMYVNSWGNWGTAAGNLQYGIGYDSDRYINSSAGYCFAIRSVKVPDHLALAL